MAVNEVYCPTVTNVSNRSLECAYSMVGGALRTAAVLAVAGASACHATGTPSTVSPSALAEQVIPLMGRYHVPRVGIAIVQSGRMVTDTVLSLDGGVTSNARFEAASLSKPVFAAVVLMLARTGRIDLDKPLATYAGWPPLQDSRAGSITARMVLSHTSGLANAADNPSQQLAFAPGHGWRYSGEGYRYLQRVVELAAGQPLDALARRLLFTPLRMTHTTFVDSTLGDADWVTGHDREGHGLEERQFKRASAATTLRTTAGDYGRFVEMMLAGAAGNDAVLTQSDINLMFHPIAVVDSSLMLSWGLGFAVAGRVAFHWGSNPGFKNFVFVDPAHRLGIAMLTNGDNGLEIAPTLVAAVTGRRYAFFRFYMLHPND
jgi:CubicO group peptidase (beta-lactamase class C family)